MITIYKTTPEGLKDLPYYEPNSWVYIESPTKAELEEVSEKLKIPLDVFTTPLDIDERSRIEEWDECSLIIVRIPIANDDNTEVPYYTIPLGIILTADKVITVCSKTETVLNRFIQNRVKRFDTEHKSRFIMQIMYEAAVCYLRYLKQISTRMYVLEEEVHTAVQNENVIKLLNLEKSLVYITTSLRANDIMFEKLKKAAYMKLSEADHDILEDVITENKQAIEMASIYNNILSGLMNAFTSIISNNLNVVMKRLTEVTLIIMIPTLITSIFGMNVPNPLQTTPHAIIIIGVLSFAIAAGVYIIVKRRWFKFLDE